MFSVFPFHASWCLELDVWKGSAEPFLSFINYSAVEKLCYFLPKKYYERFRVVGLRYYGNDLP